MSAKFLLDESVGVRAARALRRRGADVLTALEAGLRGGEDADLFALSAREGRVLVSYSATEFARIVQNPGHLALGHPGVLVGRPIDLDDLVRALLGYRAATAGGGGAARIETLSRWIPERRVARKRPTRGRSRRRARR